MREGLYLCSTLSSSWPVVVAKRKSDGAMGPELNLNSHGFPPFDLKGREIIIRTI